MGVAYEAIFIVDSTLTEEQYGAISEKYQSVVTRGGGSITDVDVWEPRRLAYEVKGRREGRYIVVNFTSDPATRDELDRIFRISDDTLRHLIIKQDPRADKYPSRTRAAEQERRAAEAAARAAAAPAIAPQPVTDLGDTAEAPAAEVAEEAPAEATEAPTETTEE